MQENTHIIMENDNDAGVEAEVPDLPAVEEGKEDTTDWKATALKMQGMAKRFKTKIDKMAVTAKPESQSAPKPAANQGSQGFDYGQLAFLEAKGITNDEDQSYLENLTKESGTKLKDLLSKSWVQAELKERAAHRTTAAATPSGTKRAGNQTVNDVDYWIAQGKLPPNTPENQKLRRDVVNARQARESSGNVFSDMPVVR